MEPVYADFNATTPLCSASKIAMFEAFDVWGNPSSSHSLGREARKTLDEARREVAAFVGVAPTDLVFTSGGSEANVMALMGAYFADPKIRILSSGVEHSSVRDCLSWLKSQGVAVHEVALEPSGSLDPVKFEADLDSFRPSFVSLMTANNETGTLFPISEIGGILRKRGILFHTDAVQALGKVPADTFLSADFISISGHKVYGPKGAGALIVRNGAKLIPTHYGGSQEVKRRGGTENVVGIIGFGAACKAYSKNDLKGFQEKFERGLKASIEDVQIQGERSMRLPNTSNIRMPGIGSDVILSALDLDGICVSAGSACSSGAISPSHVLLALGLSAVEAKECIRVSWGAPSSFSDVDRVVETMVKVVKRIRKSRGNE